MMKDINFQNAKEFNIFLHYLMFVSNSMKKELEKMENNLFWKIILPKTKIKRLKAELYETEKVINELMEKGSSVAENNAITFIYYTSNHRFLRRKLTTLLYKLEFPEEYEDLIKVLDKIDVTITTKI